MRENIYLNVKTVFATTFAIFCCLYSDLLFGNSIFNGDSLYWYGSFHYYIDSLVHGYFPYWNPAVMSGTFFYPNISIIGLLDPIVLISALVIKITTLSPFTVYVYFRIVRLLIFASGAYLLILHITKSRLSSAVASSILFLSIAPIYFNQSGTVDLVFLTPVSLWCILRLWETPSDSRRGVWLFVLALATGISMNVFIPAYFMFNISIFIMGLIVLDRKRLITVFRSFFDKRGKFMILTAVLLVVLMSAPPLTVFLNDSGYDGELFPILRIWQKGGFRQLMASDIAMDSLSETFTDQISVSGSYGFFSQMIFPDSANSLPYIAEKNYNSEADTYIGIISLIIASIGIFHFRSQYKTLILIMLLVIGINFINSYSHGSPYNKIQQVFNALFPPLKMIEVRQSFGSFFVLYLCVLLGMGLSILFNNHPEGRKPAKTVIYTGLLIISAKVVIASIIGNKIVAVSNYDVYILLQVVVFVILAILFFSSKIQGIVFASIVFCFLSVDLGFYNFSMRDRIAPNDSGLIEIIGKDKASSIRELTQINRQSNSMSTQLFKWPQSKFLGFAFQDNINRVSVTLPPGRTRVPFCTRRYYDFIANLPIEKQLYLTGVVYPILHFTTSSNAIIAENRRDAMDKIVALPQEWFSLEGPPVVIERPSTNFLENRMAKKDMRLKDYPFISELEMENINSFVIKFWDKHALNLSSIEAHPENIWKATGIEPTIISFTPNELVVNVYNATAGFFIYDDGWSRYWEAYDNGNRIPLYIANYNSKAVFLSEGSHQIHFVFNPLPYKFALYSYYFGLIVTIFIILYIVMSRPR